MSPKEFVQRINICLREARETNYWYKIINKLDIGESKLRKDLLKESNEIMLMFGAMHARSR